MTTSAKELIFIYALFLAILLAVLFVLSQVAKAETPRQAGPLGIAPKAEEISLGHRLFFDPILSADGSVSCASCHDPNKGWSDGMTVAVGIGGQAGTRNTPTILNSGYGRGIDANGRPFGQFWDARSVENFDQAVLPIQNRIEMGQQTIEQVAQRLQMRKDYVAAFASTFEVDRTTRSAITPTNIARAIACFESTINSFDAPIDRWNAGDENALTPSQKIGFDLMRKADCFSCHPAPFYTDGRTHNIGVEMATRGRIVDRGRAIVTGAAADVGAFKTPTLRSIAKSSPYWHNGQAADLKAVIRHLNVGGYFQQARRDNRGKTINVAVHDPQTDRRIKPQKWTEEQEGYVLHALETIFEGADYPLITAAR